MFHLLLGSQTNLCLCCHGPRSAEVHRQGQGWPHDAKWQQVAADPADKRMCCTSAQGCRLQWYAKLLTLPLVDICFQCYMPLQAVTIDCNVEICSNTHWFSDIPQISTQHFLFHLFNSAHSAFSKLILISTQCLWPSCSMCCCRSGWDMGPGPRLTSQDHPEKKRWGFMLARMQCIYI